jgi:hypothetical protein
MRTVHLTTFKLELSSALKRIETILNPRSKTGGFMVKKVRI